jgi:predicted kinase
LKRVLIAVYGRPGSGKSTLCAELAKELKQAALFTSAELRSSSALRGRLLDPSARSEVVARLAEQAADAFAGNSLVIVDTNLMDSRSRRVFLDLALQIGASMVLIRCFAPLALIERRMRQKPESSETPIAEWLKFVDDRISDPTTEELTGIAAYHSYDSSRPASMQIEQLIRFIWALLD